MNVIKNKLKSRFLLVWLLVLLVILGVMTGKFFVFKGGEAPSLRQVLSQNEMAKSMTKSRHLSLFIAGLLAFSFASLSAAKGYEIIKRNRSAAAVLTDELDPLTLLKNDELNREVESQRAAVEKINNTNEELLQKTAAIQIKYDDLLTEYEELKQIEQMLRKSNITLSKECERLRAENEERVLQVSQLKIKKPAKISQQKTGKVTTKARLKKAGKSKRGRKTKK